MKALMTLLLCLPHPLIEMWLLWALVIPFWINYLYNQKKPGTTLDKTGDIVSLKEIVGVGCLAGFILLTFITAFCTYLIMKTKGVI